MCGGYEVDRSSNLGAEPQGNDSIRESSNPQFAATVAAAAAAACPWEDVISQDGGEEVTDMHERSSDRTVVSVMTVDRGMPNALL